MKIYRISQTVNTGYDTFASAVVIAKDEDAARSTSPHKIYTVDLLGVAWCDPSDVVVELVGTAKRGAKPGVVCASFNAG